jgi:hypothetical protein
MDEVERNHAKIMTFPLHDEKDYTQVIHEWEVAMSKDHP